MAISVGGPFLGCPCSKTPIPFGSALGSLIFGNSYVNERYAKTGLYSEPLWSTTRIPLPKNAAFLPPDPVTVLPIEKILKAGETKAREEIYAKFQKRDSNEGYQLAYAPLLWARNRPLRTIWPVVSFPVAKISSRGLQHQQQGVHVGIPYVLGSNYYIMTSGPRYVA